MGRFTGMVGRLDTLRFRLLGTTDMLVDDEPVALPGAAERALLALLLLSAGRVVPATTLVDRLWSESALPADPSTRCRFGCPSCAVPCET